MLRKGWVWFVKGFHLYFEGVCSVEIEIEAKSYNCLNRWWIFQYLKTSCLQEMRRSLATFWVWSIVKMEPTIFRYIFSCFLDLPKTSGTDEVVVEELWGCGWIGIVNFLHVPVLIDQFVFLQYHIKPLLVILFN